MIYEKANGHVVTTILLAMVAMLFTAVSYGRMAHVYLSAGSAYTYVGQELHPALGYLTGWSMIFDYVMNPILSLILCSELTMVLIADLSKAAGFAFYLPFPAWVVGFALLFTLLNLRGIESNAHTNAYLAAGLGIVVVLFLAAAARSICNTADWSVERFRLPFYDPATFSCALGFCRDVDCHAQLYRLRRHFNAFRRGARSAPQHLAGYGAHLSHHGCPGGRGSLCRPARPAARRIRQPGHGDYRNRTSGWRHRLVLHRQPGALGGQIGSGFGAQLGAGRLLYGMGRDNAIPSRFFSAVDPRTQIPRNNIILVGVLALVGALVINLQLSAELLNFGALIGFMGVNIAAFVRYYVRGDRRSFLNFAPPLVGFASCLYVWCSLDTKAKIVGSAWLVVGLIYGTWKTRGFRRSPAFVATDAE